MAAQERRPFFCPDVVASKVGSLPLAVSLPGLIEPHSSTQGTVMVVRCLDHLVVCVVGFHTALTYIAPLGLVRFRQPSKTGVECGIQCFREGIVVNRHRFFCHTCS
jgi:hypothetical protein